MQQFQEAMDVIGNNIANVDTTGFKGARVDFEDTLSQTLRGSVNGGALQVGTGVTTGAITNQFTQGGINNTGTDTDLAIDGEGFFVVSDSVTGADYVTRAGNFHMDSNGYLATSGGLRLQGYTTWDYTAGGFDTTQIGSLRIDLTNISAASDPTASISTFSVDTNGMIQVNLSDNTQFYACEVLLQYFNNPGALIKEGSNLYSGITGAGGLTAPAEAQTNGLGKILGGALEGSNVDLANEFAKMITTQRAFQANARIISTSDEILAELVNLKR